MQGDGFSDGSSAWWGPIKNELINDDSQILPLLRLHRASQSKFVGIERGRKDLRRIDDDHKRRRYTWSRLTRLNKRNYAFDNIRRRRPSVRPIHSFYVGIERGRKDLRR